MLTSPRSLIPCTDLRQAENAPRNGHGLRKVTYGHDEEYPQDLLDQLRQDREKIATELPELLERGRRLDEAASENAKRRRGAGPFIVADFP